MNAHQNNAARGWQSYFWRKSKWQILGFAVVLAVIIVLRFVAAAGWEQAFAGWLDPAIAIGTLIVAVMVGWNERHENWRAALPKKLNILYVVADGNDWKTHVTVLDAPLAGEADIRQWGQSIGQTIFPQETAPGQKPDRDWTRISFTGFRVAEGETDHQRGIVPYYLVVFLRNKIKGAKDQHVYLFDTYGARWSPIAQVPDSHSDIHQQLLSLLP